MPIDESVVLHRLPDRVPLVDQSWRHRRSLARSFTLSDSKKNHEENCFFEMHGHCWRWLRDGDR